MLTRYLLHAIIIYMLCNCIMTRSLTLPQAHDITQSSITTTEHTTLLNV